MKKTYAIFFVLLWVAATQGASAEDGAALHQLNCVTCHAAMTGGDGSVLYTRKDRRVNSSEALEKQIDYCQTALELNWSTEQIRAVHEFLNTSFYKF